MTVMLNIDQYKAYWQSVADECDPAEIATEAVEYIAEAQEVVVRNVH